MTHCRFERSASPLRLFFFCLVLLLVGRASSQFLCGQLLNNLNTINPGTSFGQKYAAQAFRVDLATQLLNLTLAGQANGTAEVSICTGTPTSSLVPLPNASLVIAQKLNQTGRALYTYGAAPGIDLSPNVTYWVVLNGSSDWQGWLSIASNGSQPSSPVRLLNAFSLYSSVSGWVTETTAFAQLAMQGCHAVPTPPSPSPSPSAAPLATPITANVTASFGQEGPAVYLSAPAPSSETVAVSANLSAVLVGGASVPTSDEKLTLISGVGVTVQNSSSTSQEYTARLDNSTLLAHQFSFHRAAASGEFGGVTFPIGAGTVKWSINITSNDSLAGSGSITLRYLLSDFSSSFAQPGSAMVSKRSGSPLANMTTYVLFLSGVSTVAEVQVFDLALIDGVLRPINHSVVVSSSANSSSPSYVLELAFPGGFNDSLYYDPSLGLGVLLGSSGGGGDTNVGLIVGVTVGVGVAVLLVSGAIVGTVAVAWWRKKQLHADHGGVNWGNEEAEPGL